MYIANHSSIRSIDHLGEILRNIGGDVESELANLRLHHTKCNSIINNVISPALLATLVDDIGDRRFAIIVDESTDISVVKYMAICVRYFNERENLILISWTGGIRESHCRIIV